jgi:P-type Ca2+ transporter type 2C
MNQVQVKRDDEIRWYQKDVPTVLNLMQIDSTSGLNEEEVKERQAKYGTNELIEQGTKSPWRILWEQFTSVMVLILMAAALVSLVASGFQDYKNSIVIMAIVILFALLGFFQEFRAEKAMAALKRLAVPIVRVRRGGTIKEISARELVPGDMVLLETGNMVPADLRLIESINLRLQESALTGESEAVEKETAALDKNDLPLGDRKNMAYMGTVVTYGRGHGVVVETGMRTELGKIARMLGRVESEYTPLQKRLDSLGKVLGLVALGIAGCIFLLGIIKGEPLYLMLMTAVSVAVAIVPEGLPAVVTITLALGAQRMLKRQALIRKLPAVEALGSVTVICSDKTGTLTENRMTVTMLDVAGYRLDLTEKFNEQQQSLDRREDSSQLESKRDSFDPGFSFLLAGGALCNDASLQYQGEGANRYSAIGDPTEGALIIAAAKVGIEKDVVEKELPRVAELPFDSDRKRMTTVHKISGIGSSNGFTSLGSSILHQLNQDNLAGPYISFVKGSVDGLLGISSYVWEDGRRVEITPQMRKRINQANNELAQNGMRVLGIAFRVDRDLPSTLNTQQLEHELIFVGLVGMIDPPRSEVKEAVAKCKSAGIRPIMITGDHPLTARYIAQDLGMMNSGQVLTGVELEEMSTEELQEIVETVSVYARVSPEHKFRIVEALQARGHVVAMTGDGVNDAPALKRANIGVAMGITGTDVSKEASEMVLRDDNFATIVAAVEEGRTIFDNLKKFIKFSIAGNIGKIVPVLIGPLLGMPLVLQPLQLLWLNLLTDGLLGLGLGVEKSERNVMNRPPYSPTESIFARGIGRHILWLGILIGAMALGVGYIYWSTGLENWQTMLFTTLAFLQIGQALAIRSTTDSLWTIGWNSNRWMTLMVVVVLLLQFAVIYVPALQSMFGTKPLSIVDIGVCLGMGALLLMILELQKRIVVGRSKAESNAIGRRMVDSY